MKNHTHTHTHTLFTVQTYHCSAPRKLTATKMDPSCTIGFYCRNKQEFCELREEAEKRLAPPLQKGVYPFFTFIDQHINDAFTDSLEQHLNSLAGYGATMTVQDPNASLLKRRKSSGKDIDDFIIEDSDDFVIVKVKAGTGTGTGIGHSESETDLTGHFMREAEVVIERESLNLKGVVREWEELQENGVEPEAVSQAENDGGVSPEVESEKILQNDATLSPEAESEMSQLVGGWMSQWVQVDKGNGEEVSVPNVGSLSLEQADNEHDDLT